jgi:hypothetical protein
VLLFPAIPSQSTSDPYNPLMSNPPVEKDFQNEVEKEKDLRTFFSQGQKVKGNWEGK